MGYSAAYPMVRSVGRRVGVMELGVRELGGGCYD